MKYNLSILLVVACCSTVVADVRVPRIFGDNMILQQQTKNAVWGWAEPGELVTIKASWGAVASAKAGDDGRWKLFLDTPQHGTGHSLTVAEKNTIQINNVAIGEVWLCAGQSNMGWSMGNSFEAEKEADVDLPNFRIFRSEREHWHEPLEENRDRLARWKPCDPKSAAETSAVSYYFGKTLHQHLGVPVGIIQRAYAGTPIEGWMPWEIQMDDSRAVADKEILDQLAARRAAGPGPTREQALAAFEKELAEYNALIDAGEVMKNPFKQLGPPIITAPSNLGHQYPAHMFNAMVYPIRPFGIRGIIWYQGERNAKDAAQAEHYREQLVRLIGFYRESWYTLSGGGTATDLPFQLTQLPSWHPPQSQPVEGVEATWAVSREAMRLVSREVPNAGMVVSIDTGDAYALHPKNKKPIGIRHALLALANTYGKDIIGSGPRFRSMEVDGAQLRLRFESVGSGLMTARSVPPDAFAIAGKDRQWHWAQAEIEDDSVVLSAPEIRRPVAARYAWAMNPSQRNLLYNREGLPASPFRTDDWPLFDPAAEPVEVAKPQEPSGYQAVDWMRPEMTQASGRSADRSAVPTDGSATGERRPNLILFLIDDQDYESIATYGGKTWTPNLDRMAAEGMKFTRAHVSSTVCTPSRYSWLTGRYAGASTSKLYDEACGGAGQQGFPSFNVALERDRMNVGHLLRQAGYETGFVGKFHVASKLDWPEFFQGPAGLKEIPRNAPPGTDTSGLFAHNERVMQRYLEALGFSWAKNIYPENLNSPYAHHNAEWTTAAALEFIEANKDRPFYLHVCSTLLHGPDRSWRKSLDHPRVTGAGEREAPLETQGMTPRSELLRALAQQGFDPDAGGVAGEAWIDDALGAVLKKVSDLGIQRDTLVVFAPDHGSNAKSSLFAHDGTRIPMIAWWPGRIPGGLVCNELVQNIDWVPSAYDLARTKPPAECRLDGRSLVPLFATGTTSDWRDHLYFEMGNARGIATKDWSYVAVRYPVETVSAIQRATPDRLPRLMAYIGRLGIGTRGAYRPGFWDADQLYNLNADPDERINLAADPSDANQMKEMQGLLAADIRSVGRPFGEFVPGGNAASPGQIDAQIKQVKQLSVQGRNVTVPDDIPESKKAARKKRKTSS